MPTIEERLASLETRMDAMAELRIMIAELRGDMNRQFVEFRGDVNGRFDDVNRRLSTIDEKGDRHFTWMVSTQVALLLAVVGALVGAYYR